MEVLIKTINEEYEELEKSQVKGFVRTRRGKMERVNQFERKGEKKISPKDIFNQSKKVFPYDKIITFTVGSGKEAKEFVRFKDKLIDVSNIHGNEEFDARLRKHGVNPNSYFRADPRQFFISWDQLINGKEHKNAKPMTDEDEKNWFAKQKEKSEKRQAAGKFTNDDILDIVDKHFEDAEKYAMKDGKNFEGRFTQYIEKMEPRIKGRKKNLYSFYNSYQPQ